ncbi:MAG: glycoside hydrolase family 44 protein [Caldilineaceae bacterium]
MLTQYPLALPAARWSFTVPLAQLGNPDQIARQLAGCHRQRRRPSTSTASTIVVDDPPTIAPPTHRSRRRLRRPTWTSLAVDVAADRHAISDYIYGIHYVEDESFAQEIDLPVRRWGGNDTTRYNWQNDMFGNPDWYFENSTNHPADDFIDKNQRTGADSIITLPMSGWVGCPAVGDSPTRVATTRKYNYTPPYRYADGSIAAPPPTPMIKRSHCGGITGYQNGSNFLPATTPDTSIAVTSQWATEWIAHLIQTHGAADSGGVLLRLDNEPDLWPGRTRRLPHGIELRPDRDRLRLRRCHQAADRRPRFGLCSWAGPYYWHSPRWAAGIVGGAPDPQGRRCSARPGISDENVRISTACVCSTTWICTSTRKTRWTCVAWGCVVGVAAALGSALWDQPTWISWIEPGRMAASSS